MEKYLTFEGIEINCSLDEFIAKLEKKGLVLDTPPFGDEIMLATMRGEYADYEGICNFLITTNTRGQINTIVVTGESYYSIDNILVDFDYFYSKAEEYTKFGFELILQEDDYFDEDDIDSIRDGSLAKKVLFKRESDDSAVMVAVNADREYDTFNVSMSIVYGMNDNDIKSSLRAANNLKGDIENHLIQEESNHLIFNGVEMSGALDDFVEELEAKGFHVDNAPEWVSEDHEIATMHGPFMGEPCNLILSSNDIGDISIVHVKKKERKSFDIVKDEFYKLLDAYSKKYGDPNELEESLIDVPNPIISLKNEDATLGAFFRIGNNGSAISISVCIEEDSRFPYISIGYFDGIGMSSTDEENNDWDDVDLNDYYDDI